MTKIPDDKPEKVFKAKRFNLSIEAVLLWTLGFSVPLIFAILAFYDFEKSITDNEVKSGANRIDSINRVIDEKIGALKVEMNSKSDSIGEINKLLLGLLRNENQIPIIIDRSDPTLIEILKTKASPVVNSPKINLDVIRGLRTEISFFENCGYCNQKFEVDTLKAILSNINQKEEGINRTRFIIDKYSDLVRRIKMECKAKSFMSNKNKPRMYNLDLSLSSNSCNTDYSILFSRLEIYLSDLEKNWLKLRELQEELTALINDDDNQLTPDTRKTISYQDGCLKSD